MQTPQHFYNVVPHADIFNHHNLTFYQAMQPGLDAWGSTVCCGTNFVARASCLYTVGYFPTESITEDYLLSLKLATAGADLEAVWHGNTPLGLALHSHADLALLLMQKQANPSAPCRLFTLPPPPQQSGHRFYRPPPPPGRRRPPQHPRTPG